MAAKKKFAPIKITLTFSESDIDEILAAAYYGDNEPPRAKDLSPAQIKRLTQELQNTPFVDELVEGSREACANDWLSEFMQEEFPEEDEE